jgi:hypothetical protein
LNPRTWTNRSAVSSTRDAVDEAAAVAVAPRPATAARLPAPDPLMPPCPVLADMTCPSALDFYLLVGKYLTYQ